MMRVFKTETGDWAFECEQHSDGMTCPDWQLAMEAAYGHFVWWHKPFRPMFEVTVSDGYHVLDVWGIADRIGEGRGA